MHQERLGRGEEGENQTRLRVGVAQLRNASKKSALWLVVLAYVPMESLRMVGLARA